MSVSVNIPFRCVQPGDLVDGVPVTAVVAGTGKSVRIETEHGTLRIGHMDDLTTVRRAGDGRTS